MYIKPEGKYYIESSVCNYWFYYFCAIGMLQSVDKTGGYRTLYAHTKSDKPLEGLRDKVTADDVNVGQKQVR